LLLELELEKCSNCDVMWCDVQSRWLLSWDWWVRSYCFWIGRLL
jgi:hypothetical protein